MANSRKHANLDPDPLWYKDAIIYEAHVRTFFDSNNDGVGDFPGLTRKLEYLQNLGVNCLWLLPFYPSPLRDDGYDIAHYEGIHPSYGTLRDFRHFMREAHERGIRVITELVVNHTSDEHPWFQAARGAPGGSSKRNFYVWSDTDERYRDVRIIFTDTEKSNWTWDPEAKAYYWHRFFHHQPDLNYDNPRVRRAVMKVMRFWLDMGVDGLRLDAVPYLIEREGTICENLPETHQILRDIRRELDAYYTGRVLLAEANQWPADVRPYFGDGDECHMAYHFPLMPRMFMALRQEDRHPITEILRQTPDIPENCQWALFLRNHDEMTLEMVTDEERDYMYQAYAADPQMRLNVGIRRRLAPLMENHRRRVELMNSLLFSLPGTPVIYYGDELGMGDNIYLGDRNGVRTPMQWTGDRNGGFSRADPARLYAPPIMDPVYGYQAINVEAQEQSAFSLLNWMKRMIGLRRQHRTFSRGTLQFLPAENRKVLPYIRRHEDEVILCVANLARTVQPVELDLSRFKGYTPVEMLGLTEFPRVGELPYFLTLAPYSFYWFKLQQAPSPIGVRMPAAGDMVHAEELPALLMGPVWESLLEGNVRTLLERDLLLPYLQRQRWFGAKARTSTGTRIVDWAVFRRGPEPAFFTLVDVDYAEGGTDRYFLALALRGGAEADAILRDSPGAVVARVAGARRGVLYDGMLDDQLVQDLLEAIAGRREVASRLAAIRAFPTSAFAEARGPAGPVRIVRRAAEQSNTSVIYGTRLILKLFRRIEPGVNPDFEIGRHLTERVTFDRAPRVAGAFAYEQPGLPPTTLAILQELVNSQGDGWEHAVDELGRYFERTHGHELPAGDLTCPTDSFVELSQCPVAPIVQETVGGYLETAATLGRRTAEMHLALAQDCGDPAFAAEPLAQEDLHLMARGFRGQALSALQLMEESVPRLEADVAEKARLVLESRDQLLARLEEVTVASVVAAKTRIHGDYHLGQVLWVEQDFYILDFEGEPARPLTQRRGKQSPLKDVAGMLRSFSYAAYAGLFAHTAHRPEDFVALEPWARLWHRWSASAFLRSYIATAGAAPFVPPDARQFDMLLRGFLLEKALYELQYELNNRPAWVRIPLWGILPLAGIGGEAALK